MRLRAVLLCCVLAGLWLAGCGGADPAPTVDDPETGTPADEAADGDAPEAETEPAGDAGASWTVPSVAPALQEAYVIPEQDNYVYALAFAPDGAQFASGDADGNITLWDAETGSEEDRLEGHDDGINGLAFTPDGRLVSASSDMTARVWDLASGQSIVLEGAEREVQGVAVSPDGQTVAASSWDGWVRLYATDDGAEVDRLQMPNAAQAVAFSRAGDVLAVGMGNGALELWAIPDGQRLHTLDPDGATIQELAFSDDDALLFGATNKSTVFVWDVEAGERTAEWEEQETHVRSLALSPDGTIVATGAANGYVRLFTSDGTMVEEKRNSGGVHAVEFSPTTALLVTTDGQRISAYTLR